MSFAARERATETRYVMERGTAVTADVKGGSFTSTTRRTSGGYTLYLTWKTGDLLAFPSATVPIPSAYANTIIADNTLLIDQIEIKYMPGERNRLPVLVQLAGASIEEAEMHTWMCGLIALLLLLAAAVVHAITQRLDRLTIQKVSARAGV
jgi:hypothetical protein